MTTPTTKLFSLTNKAVFISGAGGAIGSVLAKAFAAAGAVVALHDISPERLAPVQKAIEEAGGRAHSFVADLTDANACRKVIDEAHAALGRLDVLVNSAGTNRRKPAVDVTPEDFDAIVDVNLRSVYFLSQAVHRHFAAQGGGKIVNISSLSAKFAFNTISVYAATKAGVSQLTKALAREWVGDNIQVNSIEPGFIKTEFTRPLWDDDYRAEWFRNFIPTGRLGTPEDLIGTVFLLSSGASAYITGQAIVVDGGILAGASWVKLESAAA